MLLGLRVENITLLEKLELTFDKGFTVITGETGAGKSIFLEALDALFGGNQTNSGVRLLRAGASYAQIEASFLGNPAADFWLRTEGFEVEDEIVVSREWRLKGDRLSNRCRINGVLINRHQISSLRSLLIDLTVQGQSLQLSSTTKQLLWLDVLGSDLLKETLKKAKSSWQLWQENFLKLENAKKEIKQQKENDQELEELLSELEAAELDDPFEDRNLQIEENRLVNGVKLQEGFSSLFFRLHEGSNEIPSVLDQLANCIHELKIMSNFDTTLNTYLDKTFDLHDNIKQLILDLEQHRSLLDDDSSRLDKVQTRLSLLKKLQRRYDLDLPKLLKRRDDLRSSQITNNFEVLIRELEVKEIKAREQRDSDNISLTKAREKVAIQFEKDLMKYLRRLGLSNVRFKIQFNSCQPTAKGADEIQFLFSSNPGQDLAPLVEIASGGEMSRFLLALKTVLSEVNGFSTLLFDEIDAGVSGRISGAIASVLKDLALKRQVFCVTHQPLVAAVADNHFSVVKSVKDGITRSHVVKLSDIDARQRELAELAGGDFAEARVYAASLLGNQAA